LLNARVDPKNVGDVITVPKGGYTIRGASFPAEKVRKQIGLYCYGNEGGIKKKMGVFSQTPIIKGKKML